MERYTYGNLNEDKNKSYYYSYNNVLSLLDIISSQFKEISRLSSIGKSYEKRDMKLLTLGLNIVKNEDGPKSEIPPSILITSVHHAREVVGVTMNMYTILSILHSYQHNDKNIASLLKMHNLYFLPFVNVDGYYKIFDTYYLKNKHYPMIRKNRHDEGGCSDSSLGVDLNRNYGYRFGYDDRGSSGRK